jgi:hypothetical protein
MRFDQPRCSVCGQWARGTLELLPGLALLIFHDNGEAEYQGETKIAWNDQVPYRDAKDRVTLQCPNGHQWQAHLTNA